MKIAFVGDSLVCPACGVRRDEPGLQRCSCGVECYLEEGKMTRTSEQMRLLQNWAAVLREIGTWESAGAQW